ncbi:MAG: hypothetical protein B7Z55_14185 [Planctomycetales bacterium 12-60-4]|nr:MAG: hypothetical protein B7Z55_14185 [Planctomycetales bacterium 12-60-4]
MLEAAFADGCVCHESFPKAALGGCIANEPARSVVTNADLQYAAGRLHGCSRRWWKNGKVHSVQWFVDGVMRGEHTDFYEDGSPLREKHFDAEGELHGRIFVWGGPGWSTPHEFHYRHGQLHGTKTIVGKDGIVHLSVEYRDGKLVRPMHKSESLTMGRLLFLLWQQHGSVSRYQNSLATGRASLNIESDRPHELVGEPSDELGFGDQTGSAIISYRCSDGELFFRRRQNSPDDTEVVYDLLTKQQVESMANESWLPKSLWTSSIFSRAIRHEKEMARALSEASRLHTGNQ